MHFAHDAPPDILIEREVDRAIENGFRVPRWGWPIPGPYNGATGHERIIGWQKVRVAEDLGLLGTRQQCGLCRALAAPQKHVENYFRPLTSQSICRSCHFHIHRRFKQPHEWRTRVMQAVNADDWIARLLTVEMTRNEAMLMAMQWNVWGTPRTSSGG